MDGLPVGRLISDALKELKELRRADNRIWDCRSLDQFFLSHLRAQVSARGKPLAADHRERDVVAHAGFRLSSEDVAGRSFEEFQGDLVFERRRIRDVHDHLRSGQCLSQNLLR